MAREEAGRIATATGESRWITGEDVDVNGGLWLGPKEQPQPQ